MSESIYDIRYPAGEMEIRGQVVQVFVGATDSGQWYGTLARTEYSSETKDGLRTRLMAASRKAAAKVDVRFHYVDAMGRRFAGSATGIHASNRNILVTWDGTGPNFKRGSQQIEHRYGSSDYYRPLSSAELEELVALRETEKAARDAVKEFGKEHGLNLRDAISAEIARQAATLAGLEEQA